MTDALRQKIQLFKPGLSKYNKGTVLGDRSPQLPLDQRVAVEQPEPGADRQVAVGAPPHSARQANPSISIRQPSDAS